MASVRRLGWPVESDERFSDFVDSRWGRLVRSAFLLGCSIHEAEDLVQTTLTRCYPVWERVEASEDIDAYVYRALVNAQAKSRRRRWWGERPTDALPDSERLPDPADLIATVETVRAALRQLTPEHRSVLVLHFFADLSEQQTADALGIPAGTVKSRTARAIQQLSEDESLAESMRT